MGQPAADEEKRAVDDALRAWRQGDVSQDVGLEFLHLADLSRPHSPESVEAARLVASDAAGSVAGVVPLLSPVPGVVMLTQTCDIVRACQERPFVEIAPLVQLSARAVEEVRRLKRPAFAYIPATAEDGLVADLDRTMTVEKAVVAGWTRVPGWTTDEESRAFAQALSRKRARFAFPDEFVAAAQQLQRHLVEKHDKQTGEGAHLRALREIRVRAAPSWDSQEVQLSWWFIKDQDPAPPEPNWARFADEWIALFDQTGRFRADPPTVCRMEDMTAQDYVESVQLDLDRLSAPRQPELRA